MYHLEALDSTHNPEVGSRVTRTGDLGSRKPEGGTRMNDLPEDAEARYEIGETGKRHTFVLRRKLIHIRFLDRLGRPICDTPCEVNYDDGYTANGCTDGRGWATVAISRRAEWADVSLSGVQEDAQRRVYLVPPHDPKTDRARARQCLWNLGFTVDPNTEQGIREFQETYGLVPTGQPDAAFKQKLEEIYEEHRQQDGTDEEEEDDAAAMDDDAIGDDEGRT